jgi:hypothetical protein
VSEIPSVKIDQMIGTKGKLTFFWQRTKTENPNGNTIFGASDGLPDPLTTALGTFQTAPLYRLNYDYTISPTMLLHLGAGYRSNDFFVPSVTTKGQITNYNAAQQLGLTGGIENKFFPTMLGLLSSNGTGGMKTIGSEAATDQITQSPSFNVYLNWVRENHTYKFGSEFRTEGYPPRVDGNTDGVYSFSAAETGQPFQTAAVAGSNVGFAYASFLLGLVDQVQMSNPTRPRTGKKQLGLYAQDSWKINRKFTLDYGLRYDFSTYLREEYGRAPEFSPTTMHPLGIPGAAIYDGSGPGRCNCNIAHNYPYAFGPRLGAAYQISDKTVLRAGFGIVYGGTATNNNSGSGLAASSATTIAPSFGVPVTTLAQGIPTSFRPAPWPNYDPGYFPTFPTGTVQGTPGPGPVWMDPNAGRPPRQYQWSIGVQREVAANLVVEASYVANRGVWWQAPGLLNLDAITPDRLKAFGLDITSAADRALLLSTMSSPAVVARGFTVPYPTFPKTQLLAQALRPFPQYTSIPVYWNPMGKTWYDSLQLKATQRLSRGLTFFSAFTWSKALTLGSEVGEPNPGTTGNAVVNNVFSRNLNKYISAYDQPFQWNTSLTYTTPRFSEKYKILSSVLSNWTYGTFLQYASGFPLQAPNAQTSLNSYLFQGASLANRVPGQPLFTVDPNCHCYDPNKTFLLNPKAWADPDPGQFGNSPAYYSDYRTQRRPQENMNIGRTFKIREGMTINLRLEVTNVFNRSYWNSPSGANLTNAHLDCTVTPTPSTCYLANGTTNAGFGKLVTTGVTAFGTTANLLPRQGLLVGRFNF